MARILVLYDSHDGHAGVLAHAIAEVVRERGYLADVRCASALLETFSLRAFDGAAVVAQSRLGRYPAGFVRFVRENAAALQRLRAWLFSECLEAASPRAPAPRDVERLQKQTGWRPYRVAHVAGSLRYRDAGLFDRLRLRLQARALGLSTDVTRNHDYTDWPKLRAIAREFAVQWTPGREAAPRAGPDELAAR